MAEPIHAVPASVPPAAGRPDSDQGRLEEAQTWERRGRELDPLAVGGHDLGWTLFSHATTMRLFENCGAIWPCTRIILGICGSLGSR